MPPENRRSMLASSVFGVLSWLAPIILGFVSTPVLIKGLGVEAYGVYALILGFLSYSFTFGIGRAAAKYVAEYSASGEARKLSDAVSGVLIFSIVVGILGATILAFLTPWMVSDLLLLPESLKPAARASLYIACVIGLLTMIAQVFQSTLQGAHRFDTGLVLSVLNALLLSVGNIVLALLGYGIEVLLAWNLFSVVVSVLLFSIAATRAVPQLRPTLRPGRETAMNVIRYGGNIILFQIFGNALFLLERSIVVRRFGAEAVTYYSVPMFLGLYMHGAVVSFVWVLFPRMNELLNDREQLTRLYLRANRYVVATIAVIATSLIVCGPEFLTFWVGSEVSAQASAVLVFHILTFSILAAFVIVWHVAESFRAAGINVVVTFTWLAIGGTVMLLVGSVYGIEGIAAARLAATSLTIPVIFYIEKRFLGSVQTRHWLRLAARVGLAAIVLSAFQMLTAKTLPLGWPQLFVAIGGGVLVYGGVLYLIGFFEDAEIRRVQKLFFSS